MKCEICHKEDAKVAVRRVVDGVEKELYVCHACAARSVVPEGQDKKSGAMHFKIDGAKLPEAVIGAFLKQMVEAAGGVNVKVLDDRSAPLESGKPCPVCGMFPNDYKRLGRLGCDACYEAFARQLQPIIRDMHPGIAHAGKFPVKPSDGELSNG